MPKYKTIKPFGIKTNRLPLQFAIIVPSTEKNVEIAPRRFGMRMVKEKNYLDKLFGGDTSLIGKGSSKITGQAGKPVVEPVGIVETSTTPKKFENRRDILMQHIQDRQKRWKQDTIFYKIEGETFIYPKKKFIGNYNTKNEILLT